MAFPLSSREPRQTRDRASACSSSGKIIKFASRSMYNDCLVLRDFPLVDDDLRMAYRLENARTRGPAIDFRSHTKCLHNGLPEPVLAFT